MTDTIAPTPIQENIFLEGSSFFQACLQDIHAAKKTIDIEMYIFSNDNLGNKIADALYEAAKRGVKVRILIDGAGSPLWGGTVDKKLEDAGAQVRIFHPFPWGFWQWSRSKIRLPFILKIIYLILKINSRNHRKVFMFDNAIAYVGSFNISDCHIDKDHQGNVWRDTGIRLQHVDLKPLLDAFEGVWNHRDPQERIKEIFRHVNTNPIFRLNNSWHRRRILYKNLLRRITQCKQRIWITNAYFVPDNILLKKLKDAASRNVDVRILLPQKSDIFIMPWASMTFYSSLLKAGVRIFEYTPSMLHAKTLMLDEWTIVGSSNLNHRSLLHDLEIDVNIQLPASKQQIEQQFLQDLTQTKEIHLEYWQERPLYQRLIGYLALYAKFWI